MSTTWPANGQTDFMKYQLCGKRSQKRPLKDFSSVNETGPGHEVKDAVRYTTMMIMMMVMMNAYSL